jgi:hypothetical protein
MFGEVREENIWKEMRLENLFISLRSEKKMQRVIWSLSGPDRPNRIISVFRFGSYSLSP